MSWHYSRALVAEYSQACSLAGELFAPLKETDTPETYCWRDKMTGIIEPFSSLGQRYNLDGRPWRGLVDVVSGGFPCQDISVARAMWGRAGIGGERSGLCGETCELLGRFNLPKFSVKTRRLSERLDLTKLSQDLPASGMCAAGLLWVLTPLDLITNASGSGSTLPTPSARDWKDTLGMGTFRTDGKTRLDRLPMLLFEHVRNAGMSTTTNWAATGARTVVLMDLVQTTIFGTGLLPTVAGMGYGMADWLDRIKAVGNGQVPAVAALCMGNS